MSPTIILQPMLNCYHLFHQHCFKYYLRDTIQDNKSDFDLFSSNMAFKLPLWKIYFGETLKGLTKMNVWGHLNEHF